MNKPLSEWTLGEIKQRCDSCCAIPEDCVGCPARQANGDCAIGEPFGYWDLSEPPRWTEQEAELAKALYELRRSVSLVIGRSTGGILWWRDGDRGEGILPHKLFPSLNEGNCVRLDEIIGGGE